MDLPITSDRIIQKFRDLYPREFNHVISDVRADALEERVEQLEARLAEQEPDS